jgi:hypothetical protein|tara:strand:+ start:3042 stop:3368 length:327 start_codon:yes stop_codon:yes gene_type:complete
MVSGVSDALPTDVNNFPCGFIAMCIVALFGMPSAANDWTSMPNTAWLGIAVSALNQALWELTPSERLKRLGLSMEQFDVTGINETFADPALACTRQLGLGDNDVRVNP